VVVRDEKVGFERCRHSSRASCELRSEKREVRMGLERARGAEGR
jgi:hypothetical protein